MTTKHTELPWRLMEDGQTIAAKSDTFICRTEKDNQFFYQGISRSEAQANARLIAAAPELLDAAKKAVESLVAMQEMLHSRGMAYGAGLTHKMLSEAIQKADGNNLFTVNTPIKP